MVLNIEDYTPLDKSKIRDFQKQYFDNKGITAWLWWDIPFDITNNSFYASQVAYMFFLQIESSSKKDTYNVIEYWAWVGLFAINFIKSFKKICLDYGKDYFWKLNFIVTDYSYKNLEELEKLEVFQKYKKQGVITFRLVELPDIDSSWDLNWEFQYMPSYIDFAVFNYTFCSLPIGKFKLHQYKLYEKYISLSKKLDFKSIFWKINLQNLNIKEQYFPSYNNYNYWIKNYIIEKDVEETQVPIYALETIKKVLNKLTKKWSIVVSDVMLDKNIENIKNYKDNIFHKLNFDFLVYFLKSTDINIYLKESNILTTMMVTYNDGYFVKSWFDEKFINEDINETTYDYLKTAYSFLKEKKYKSSKKYFKKALYYREYDANIYYRLSEIENILEEFESSKYYKKLCKKYDYFGLYTN